MVYAFVGAGSLLVCLEVVNTGTYTHGATLVATRRQQDSGLGPTNDGSQGVDSEDIMNIPDIGLSSFQLFPDQFNYGPDDPNLPPFNNTVNQGLDWIRSHAEVGRL